MKEHKPIDQTVHADTQLLGLVNVDWLEQQGFTRRNDREFVHIVDKHEVVYALQAGGNYKYDHTKPIEEV